MPAINSISGDLFTSTFEGCSNLVCLTSIDTTGIISTPQAADMFLGCTSLVAPTAGEQTTMTTFPVALAYVNGGVCPPAPVPFDMNFITTPITSKTIVDTNFAFMGMTWGDSGSKVYVVNLSGNVNQYEVGTPYDITTLVDTGTTTSFDVAAEVGLSPNAVEFSSDGTKMYVSGSEQWISQYTLTTAWDLGGTVTHFGDGTTDANGWIITGMHFNATGTHVYQVIHNFGPTSYINSQAISTPWDITTIQPGATYVDIGADTDQATGIHLSDDGTLLQVSSNHSGQEYVLQYVLSIPFDESSITLDLTYNSSVLDIDVEDVTFNNDGTIMYLFGQDGNTIYQIPLLT